MLYRRSHVDVYLRRVSTVRKHFQSDSTRDISEQDLKSELYDIYVADDILEPGAYILSFNVDTDVEARP